MGAPTKAKASAAAPKKSKTVASSLFPARPKNYRIGGDIQPKRDLSRFVRWPRYVRIQRQRKIIMQRLKIPPAISQFATTLNKNLATELFKLLLKYKPENRVQKQERLLELAKIKESGKALPKTEKPYVVKFGLKHVTNLIESKKAKLVVIASDVQPLELVLWLPALCRKMDIPFCIVKNKARLGTFVNFKNATCLALTRVRKEDESKLSKLCENFRQQFDTPVRKWGGGIMGLKTQAKLAKRQAAIEAELAKKKALI